MRGGEPGSRDYIFKMYQSKWNGNQIAKDCAEQNWQHSDQAFALQINGEQDRGN